MQFFKSEEAKFWAAFSAAKFDRKWFGQRFRRFLYPLIWSPCKRITFRVQQIEKRK
jgi:hypothetical protein